MPGHVPAYPLWPEPPRPLSEDTGWRGPSPYPPQGSHSRARGEASPRVNAYLRHLKHYFVNR